MSSKKKMRRRVFVDAMVQGALAMRVVFYWALCLVTIALMLLCWRMITGPLQLFSTHLRDMWFAFGPAAVASLLLLPLVVADVIRLSHRFVGPILRLRRLMREIAAGEHVEPIHFRQGDFWKELAEDFNKVIARVQAEESAPAQEDSPDLHDAAAEELVGADA